MSTGKLVTTLLLLLFCVKYSYAGVKKIKIHVPYYVKHVHHYKKIFVPKIHVIKHEHHHKKEYDHHHHHHEVYKHGPYRSYDKSSFEYPDDFSYDDYESKSHRARKRIKPFRYKGRFSEQYKTWKDVDGSDYSSEEDEDYGAYRKNYYFKRRSGTDEDENEEPLDKNEKEGEEEEPEEEEEEGEEEEEEEHNTPVDTKEIISITTTANPLL